MAEARGCKGKKTGSLRKVFCCSAAKQPFLRWRLKTFLSFEQVQLRLKFHTHCYSTDRAAQAETRSQAATRSNSFPPSRTLAQIPRCISSIGHASPSGCWIVFGISSLIIAEKELIDAENSIRHITIRSAAASQTVGCCSVAMQISYLSLQLTSQRGL